MLSFALSYPRKKTQKPSSNKTCFSSAITLQYYWESLESLLWNTSLPIILKFRRKERKKQTELQILFHKGAAFSTSLSCEQHCLLHLPWKSYLTPDPEKYSSLSWQTPWRSANTECSPNLDYDSIFLSEWQNCSSRFLYTQPHGLYILHNNCTFNYLDISRCNKTTASRCYWSVNSYSGLVAWYWIASWMRTWAQFRFNTLRQQSCKANLCLTLILILWQNKLHIKL